MHAPAACGSFRVSLDDDSAKFVRIWVRVSDYLPASASLIVREHFYETVGQS